MAQEWVPPSADTETPDERLLAYMEREGGAFIKESLL